MRELTRALLTTIAATFMIAGAAQAGLVTGGPVIIGGDAADERGGFNDCSGCGKRNEGRGECTNTCFLNDCDDSSRTVRVSREVKDGEAGGSCRQFDGDQAACEQAWHPSGQRDVPASCFFCASTEGKCEAAGECRGCGKDNLKAGACSNTCTPSFCEDVTRTNPLGGPKTNACQQFDGNPTACEQAWHLTEDGLPASCFVCVGDEGKCGVAGDCRGCGRRNSKDGLCTNTCLTCADPTRTTLSTVSGQNGGSCQVFDGDPTACETGWHLSQSGLPASCFLEGGGAPGNSDGWKYIEEGFDAIGQKVTNGNTLAVCLGCNDEPGTDDSASGAFEFGFDESGLPGMGWTRVRLADVDDIADFFNDTGATKITEAAIIYLPSDGDNVRGGIRGADAPCRGCGATREAEGKCADTCGAPPTCIDGARTIDAGGPREGVCKQFTDQGTCEQAWHRNKFGVASSCFWDGAGCRGCGKNNASAGCTNTCVPPPACEDAGRTVALGGPGFAAGTCQSINNQTDCEQAWHTTGGFKGASCFWTGSSCQTCSPKNEQGGVCTNTCSSEVVTCDDLSRSKAAGAPDGAACQQFDGDAAACNAAWHVTRGGSASSCFAEPDQIAIVNANAATIADFVQNGGGLFTHTQDRIAGGWEWLRTLLPGVVPVPDNGCQSEKVRATAAGTATFPDLDATTLNEITSFRSRFAGDFGGLHVLGAGDCARPVFDCPPRPRLVRGSGGDGGSCRAFDDDQTACEQAWHVPDDDTEFPASCFFCAGEEGQCEAAGECRGCGETNIEEGACANACIDPTRSLCLDASRTNPLFGDNVCPTLTGDPEACKQAWHFDNEGIPSSCFVCKNDTGQCEGAGDCRGCGEKNRERGVCENTCAEEAVCQDRKRKTLVDGDDGSRACREFDGDRKACEKSWHLDVSGVPTTCFFCEGTEGKCQEAGECRGCGPRNVRAGACTDTCGAVATTAVLLGGCPVTFEPALDHFEGYKLKKAPKLDKNCHLLLDDTSSTGWDGATEYTVSKVAALLAPADKTQKDLPPTLVPQQIPALDDLVDEATHLVGYAMKRKKGAGKHAKRRGVLTLNQFGTLRFDTNKEDRFLALAHKDFDSSPSMPDGSSTVDHYKCYKIKVAKADPGSQQSAKGKFQKRQAIVVDQFESGRRYVCQGGSPANVGGACKDDSKCGGNKAEFTHCGPGDGHPEFDAARVYDLKKPTRYCVAVDKSTGTDSSCPVVSASTTRPDLALTCYQKKTASKNGRTGKQKINPKQQKHVARPVFVRTWIQEHEFSTSKEEELCVPSTTVELGSSS